MTSNATSDGLWSRWSLPTQFLLAGALVMSLAMVCVGHWVVTRIERGVVQNAAASAADFVETFVAPLAEDFAEAPPLSEPAKRALTEVFSSDAVNDRIVSYKIWSPGGEILMASNADMVGQIFQEGDDLQRAWAGQVAASYGDFGDEEDDVEAGLGIPLLEVYSPLHAYYSGDVVAVVEFYQNGSALAAELTKSRRSTWLVVIGAFLTSGLLLFGIVLAGGRTINRQRELLELRLAETSKISAQNADLRKRAVAAAARATAQSERAYRQLGADLHDGPGQHLALAALRLDAILPKHSGTNPEAEMVRNALSQAMTEIRALSRGRALPDLDQLTMSQAITRVVEEHHARTGEDTQITGDTLKAGDFGYAEKLCAYRFLQETLANATRHAKASHVTLSLRQTKGLFTLCVQDDGIGFDQYRAAGLRPNGGQGLVGLVDRAESLGGSIDIDSAPGEGTRITLILPNEETSQ